MRLQPSLSFASASLAQALPERSSNRSLGSYRLALIQILSFAYGQGAPEQIRRAFASYKFTDEKYLSGDAAYCYQEVITTCLGLGVKFTFTANEATTCWEAEIPQLTTWIPWQYTSEERATAGSPFMMIRSTRSSQKPSDVTSFIYQPSSFHMRERSCSR